MENITTASQQELEQAEIYTQQEIVYGKVNAPFGYFGSKNKIALKLCEELPPHNCWIEAFCGSAALTLAKSPAPIEVINDIDSEIVNVFRQLRNNYDELFRVIELTPYAKEELINARIKDYSDSELERARKFLVQAMFAVNGVFGKEKGGFSYSQSYSRNGKDARVNRWYNLKERLEQVVERLRWIRIENKDAIELLGMFVNRPATLVYLDPPYLGDRAEGYDNDANDEEYHLKMLKLSHRAKCMIFISGYENDLYNNFLTEKKGWKRKTIGTITKDTKGHSHERSEVVWMNKHYQKAIRTGRVPVRLTKKEKKENKVNPERL
ncbi:MAG: DNA adenine methylase [Cytophagales bacterium]|nr:DNA adenine methylase [Cytophagales bacterium]